MNAHQTMTMAESAVKAPAGAPASNEITRITGMKVEKYSGSPNEANAIRSAMATARPAIATTSADSDHGLSRSQ